MTFFSQEDFPGLNPDERLLHPMCGVQAFGDSNVLCAHKRPVIITNDAVCKFHLDHPFDFEPLHGQNVYVIRRKRDAENKPINGDYYACKVEIIQFMYTRIYDMCYVECKTDISNDETENIHISRLFYNP